MFNIAPTGSQKKPSIRPRLLPQLQRWGPGIAPSGASIRCAPESSANMWCLGVEASKGIRV